MREIVHIQIGNCGNAIGTEFWQVICADHGISQNGTFEGNPDIRLERVNVYFNEIKGFQYSPRSVLIDLDKSALEAVKASPYGQIFKPNNFLFGNNGAGNNWAKGHFSEGAELCNQSLDVIRKEVEACDCFYGFQIVHSIGGGTGSGLGSLLLSQLKEEYPSTMVTCHSTIPSPKVSNANVEPYNAVLSLNHLIENNDETFCNDNEALFFIMNNVLNRPGASYCDLNYTVALVMSGVTTCLRFPSTAHNSFRKIAVNMVPFPRLHFFVTSFAPLIRRDCFNYRKYSVMDISSQLFDYKNAFAACDLTKGKFLTVACSFRGDISSKELDQQMNSVQNRDSVHFVEWIPDNIKTSICRVSFPGINRTATFVGNSTAIKDVFQRIKSQYMVMFKRKAFLHWYTGEGLEEMEFVNSEANLSDLITEYEENENLKLDPFEPFEKKCK